MHRAPYLSTIHIGSDQTCWSLLPQTKFAVALILQPLLAGVVYQLLRMDGCGCDLAIGLPWRDVACPGKTDAMTGTNVEISQMISQTVGRVANGGSQRLFWRMGLIKVGRPESVCSRSVLANVLWLFR